MSICIGNMREYVTIRPLTDDANSLGGFDQSGSNGSAIPAELRLLRSPDSAAGFGFEEFAWSQLREKILYLLTVRYRTDIAEGYVVKDEDNQEYYVLAVADPDRRKRWTVAILEKGGPRAA